MIVKVPKSSYLFHYAWAYAGICWHTSWVTLIISSHTTCTSNYYYNFFSKCPEPECHFQKMHYKIVLFKLNFYYINFWWRKKLGAAKVLPSWRSGKRICRSFGSWFHLVKKTPQRLVQIMIKQLLGRLLCNLPR